MMKRIIFLMLVLAGCAPAMEPDEVLVVAHRGASHDAPENTLPAFELAWRQGADAIEGDFHLTSDGHIVCLHDRDTAKVAGKKLVVREATLAELRALEVGQWHDEDFKGVRIPTLAEVAATVPVGKKIYVEVKCGPEIIPPLLEEIRKTGLKTEQIVVISFEAGVIARMEAEAPQFETAWLSSFREDQEGVISPSAEKVLATLKDIKADGFSSSKDRIDEAFVKQVREGGFDYHVWTVDDGETARRFLQWGAQSITTNRPGRIRRELAR